MNAPQMSASQAPTVPPARKPWYRSPGGIVAFCTAATLAVVAPLAFLGAKRNATPRVSPARIDSCNLSDAGSIKSATIGYTVTNSSSRTRSYTLRFEVVDYTGARVGDDIEHVTNVAPGQVVRGEAVALLAGTGARCGLVDWD